MDYFPVFSTVFIISREPVDFIYFFEMVLYPKRKFFFDLEQTLS